MLLLLLKLLFFLIYFMGNYSNIQKQIKAINHLIDFIKKGNQTVDLIIEIDYIERKYCINPQLIITFDLRILR